MADTVFAIAGAMSLTRGNASVDDGQFGSAQLRLVTALLLVGRNEAWPPELLADHLWPGGPPERWRPALRGLVSRVRGLLVAVGIDGDQALANVNGRYIVTVSNLRVDVETAREHLARARSALGEGRVEDTERLAGRARAVLGRPILPGIDNPWLDTVRRRAADDYLGALLLVGEARYRRAKFSPARAALREALDVAPYREDAWRALMRVESDAGNTAAALRVYEQCRARLVEDLGVDPSSDTQRLHAAILQSIPDPSATAEPALDRSPTGRGVTHPYVGLRAFTQEDSHLFFGRDAAIHQLVDMVERHGSLVVVGQSGSGKSSLVRAGLLPALAKGAIPDADTWPAVLMTPGRSPLRALAGAILSATDEHPSSLAATHLAEHLAAAPSELPHLVRNLVADHATEAGVRLVIVVDQAEELFTLAPPDEAASLLQALTSMLDRPDSLVVPVFTLRSDFYTKATSESAMVRLLTRSQFVVMPMGGHELEAAIVGPVRTVGGGFGPGVLGRVMAANSEAPGSLPLLQFALTRMWEHREGLVVDMAALERVGGITGAIAAAAEAAVADLDDDAMPAVRRLLLRLVLLTDDKVTRRREAVADLQAMADVDEDIVDRLVDARLLSGGRDPVTGLATVELAHEAIVDAWPRLHEWILSAREQLLEAQRLRTDAAAWNARGRPADHLWTGVRLDDAQALAADDDVISLSPVELGFVTAATAAARERHLAEARQQAAAANSARFRRRARLIGAVLTGLVVATVAAGVVLQRAATSDRAAAAQAELVATASGTIDTRPDLGLLLAVEAWQRDPGPAEQGVLLDGLRAFDGVVDTWVGARHDTGTSDARCVTIPEPGTVVLQPSSDPDRGLASTPGMVLEVDVMERSVVRELDTTLNCEVHRSPAGIEPVMFIGTDVAKTGTTLFDADGEVMQEFQDLTQPFFLPDGAILAQSAEEGSTAWVVIDPTTGFRSPTGLDAVRVDPVPGGPVLWAATDDQPDTGAGWPEVSLLDASTRDEIVDLTDMLGERLVEPVAAASADGGIAAVATLDGAIAIVDMTDASSVVEIPNLDPTALALDAAGKRLYSVGQENVLAIHDVDTGRLMAQLPGGPDLVMALQPAHGDAVHTVQTTGLVATLQPGAPGVGERTVPCCGADEFLMMAPDANPGPIAHIASFATLTNRVVAIDGAQQLGTPSVLSFLDEGPHPVFHSENQDGSALMIRPPFHLDVLHPDGTSEEIGDPLGTEFNMDEGQLVAIADNYQGDRKHILVVGPIDGTLQEASVVRMATVSGTGEVVDGPHDVELTHPGTIDGRAVDGGLLLVGRAEDARIIDVYDHTGTLRDTFTLAADPQAWVAMTPDGRYALTVDVIDDSIWWHDVAADQRRVLPIKGHFQPPDMLPDDRAVIQTREGELQLWDLTGPTLLGTVADAGPRDDTYLETHHDGSELWAVIDGWLRRIPLDSESWAQRACDLAARPLTEREFADLIPDNAPYRDACADLRSG